MFHALPHFNFCHGMGIEMNCYGIRVRVTTRLKISRNKKLSCHVNKDAKT
jgi:hypothetical protein